LALYLVVLDTIRVAQPELDPLTLRSGRLEPDRLGLVLEHREHAADSPPVLVSNPELAEDTAAIYHGCTLRAKAPESLGEAGRRSEAGLRLAEILSERFDGLRAAIVVRFDGRAHPD
jgi:hypothetical protein